MNIKVEEGPKMKLTKAIACQVLRKKLPTLRHPAVDYVLEGEELMSEGELAKATAIWSTGDCLGRWMSLPGREVNDTLQTLVTRKIVTSSFAGVVLDREQPHLLLKNSEGEQKIGISEGLPIVAPLDRVDQYSAHKVAALYLMVNPPITKGKMEPEPLENATKTSGSMVPKGCIQFREWDESTGRHIGPFETAYAGKPTVHQLESVFVAQTKENSMQLQSRTLAVIEPTFKASKLPHHDVIGQRQQRKILRKPVITAALPDTLPKAWRMWAKTQVLSRVSSVYDPYFGCLLPNGLAHKVHVVANLKWSVRQMECVGVASSSESSVWTKVKSLVELNLPIWSKTATAVMPYSDKGEYNPGIYRYFDRALQIIDVAGKGVPKVSAGDVSYYPNKVVEVIEGMEKLLTETGTQSGKTPVAFVAYLDPCMAEMENWVFFPLDFSTGQVLIAREGKGLTYKVISSMFARFTAYRVYYPYGRVPWPALSREIVLPLVVLRNGKNSVMGHEEDYFSTPEVKFGVVDELSGAEIAVMEAVADFVFKGAADPVLVPAAPVKLVPKTVLPPPEEQEGGEEPDAKGAAELGYRAASGEEDDDEEDDVFASVAVTPEQAAKLKKQQQDLDAEVN